MTPTKRTDAESNLPDLDTLLNDDSNKPKKAKQVTQKKQGRVRKNPDTQIAIDWEHGTGTIDGITRYKGKNRFDWYDDEELTIPVNDEDQAEIERAYSRERELHRQSRPPTYNAEMQIRKSMNHKKLSALLKKEGIDMSTEKKQRKTQLKRKEK